MYISSPDSVYETTLNRLLFLLIQFKYHNKKVAYKYSKKEKNIIAPLIK